MTLRRATRVLPAGHWNGDETVGTVTLPCADRHRRRFRLSDDGGADFLLDLPDAVHLRDGDGLALEGGGVIRVRAADEAVLDLRCRDAVHLARVAWHLGNRHLPVQVLPDGRLRIAADHVIAAMAEGLGAETTALSAPFQPEGGAYDGGGHGHHHHDHEDDHHHHHDHHHHGHAH